MEMNCLPKRSLSLLRIVLIFLTSLGGFSVTYAQDKPLRVQFVDSETGYAIQPEFRVTKNGRDRVISKAEISKAGRAAVSLERGSHWIEASSPNHRPLSGALVADGSVESIRILLDPIIPPPELNPDHITPLHRDDATIIVGFIVDEDSGEPLENVLVSSHPSGVKAKSNARGFFQLAVPVQSEAEEESSPAKLLFEKPGFKTDERQYLELWHNGDWTYRVRLSSGGGHRVVDERETRRRPAKVKVAESSVPVSAARTDSTPEQKLQTFADAPILAAADSGSPTNSMIRIPRTIRVRHSDNVTIEYVSMEFYVRRSLPAEWINSWGTYSGGTNSLKAGAVSSRSYAASYVNSPSSSTYDICATTSCQVYGTTTYTLADAAVSQTTGYVVVDSGGNISRSEYSAENNSIGFSCGDGYTQPTGGCIFDPVCSGETRYGHGRGVCQWGTVRWATGLKFPGRSTSNSTLTNGYPKQDWKWIVEHYYPTLRLVQALPLIIGDDVKIRGSSSRDVRMCADGSISNGVNCTLITTKVVGSTGIIIDGPIQILADGIGHTWYKIQWNDAGPTIGWTAENWLERIIPTPPAPTLLSATAVSPTQINLSWTDNSSVEGGYKIERGITASGPWMEIAIAGTNATTFSNTNLAIATTYYYRVRAFNIAANSTYSSVANATTLDIPPVLAAISNYTIVEGTLFTFTNTATGSEKVQMLTDFEEFPVTAPVLFQLPLYSSTTSGFLDTNVNVTAVIGTFPAKTNAGARVLNVNCSFNAVANPWLRLTTAATADFPNPVVDFTKQLRFNIYSDKTLQVGVGLRETTTVAGTPIGYNGGTAGSSLEWAGVTNKVGSQPLPNRTVPANTWTRLTFNLPTEPILSFSGGNNVLSTASGLGVLEHLALVPAGGTGAYNIYLDNFAVVQPRTLSFSLDAGAPAGASVNPATGIFSWTPTEAQGSGVYNLTLRVTDSVGQTNAKTFSITVNETNSPPSLASISNRVVHAGSIVVVTNSATDSDFPANILTFSLDPGAPSASSINSTNGIFSWTTVSADAGSVNPITVRVTDNGVPPKFDTKSFRIDVVAPPAIQGITMSEGMVTLTWSAIAGKTYRVQYKTNLEDANWIDLTDVIASDATASFSDTPGANQRFYRIFVLN
ncbi:MAG: SpoIID/LytB domain-containing protein [Verrucomicrobiota bacterium]